MQISVFVLDVGHFLHLIGFFIINISNFCYSLSVHFVCCFGINFPLWDLKNVECLPLL